MTDKEVVIFSSDSRDIFVYVLCYHSTKILNKISDLRDISMIMKYISSQYKHIHNVIIVMGWNTLVVSALMIFS